MSTLLTSTKSSARLMRLGVCLVASIAGAQSSSLARIPSLEAHDTRIATFRVLDQAVRLLGHADSDYRNILRDAIVTLPSDADVRVQAQLRTFLARVPQLGAEYQCSEDFTRARAQDMLWRLRDTLLEIPIRPVEPTVCYAVPFAVDLVRAQTATGLVDIYGYDFDTASLQLVVVTPDGFVDVTPSLTVKSHTHLTARLGNDGVAASVTNQSLGVAWGHVIHYRVPLVGPTTDLCSSRLETIPAGRTISYMATARAGHNPDAMRDTAEVRLDYTSNLLEAVLCVTTADGAASGCFREFLYTTDPDRVIEGVIGPLSRRISLAARQQPSSVQTRRGLVRQWSVAGRPPGDATTDSTSIVARLRALTVVSSDIEGCLSPMAYVEAKRTTAFPAATQHRLDAQLRRVDRAILRCRPRFAPPGASRLPK
jgi:hypothetical protein